MFKLHKMMTATAIFAACLFFSASVQAVSVTPSTNDANRDKGWAHVDQVKKGIGTTDLKFINDRAFQSCFEYRTDGDVSQKKAAANYNTGITDGLYPFTCLNKTTATKTFTAKEYVEVRMVFGAESDERFTWTKFMVDPAPVVTVKPVEKKSSGDPGQGWHDPAPFDYTCKQTRPGAVAWLSAHQETANDGKVTIWWTLPTGGDKVHIAYGEVGRAWEHAALNIDNTGSFTIGALKNGVAYYFNVAGVNGCAVGDYSFAVSAKP